MEVRARYEMPVQKSQQAKAINPANAIVARMLWGSLRCQVMQVIMLVTSASAYKPLAKSSRGVKLNIMSVTMRVVAIMV